MADQPISATIFPALKYDDAPAAEIVRPLADTPYGAREYSARDISGHLWSFGTYDPWKV